MKTFLISASVLALLGSLTAANAAEVTGRIKLIDDVDHMVTLTNGKQFTYIADPGEPDVVSPLDGFHVGEKVRITHEGGSASGITALD
ncbi:MAG: hypothetical protein J0H94_10605 [Rhizobiales bacterium]|nr:hypothetical protein [Hyphomicrobiales bacterium]